MNEPTNVKISNDMAGDLAYVRTLAEEGRDAPLVGGIYYLIWGGLMGTAALVSYGHFSGLYSLGKFGGLGPWLVAGLLGWILSFTVGRGSNVKPGGSTLGNRTAISTWFAVGIFMTVLWATLMVVHDNFTAYGIPRYFMFSLMFPISFGVYGIAFFATATASRMPWLNWFAYLSWAFCVVCLFLLVSKHQMLAGALGSFLCAALPGALLMLREPRDTV